MNKLNVPDISLWNTKAKLIKWINDGFNLERHLELRGLDKHMFQGSFGTADRAEAIRRQKLVRLFLENEALRQFVLRGHLNPGSDAVRIPPTGQRFLDYFDPQHRNVFWETLSRFIKIADSTGVIGTVPALSQFVEYLRYEQARIEDSEAKMGGAVIDQLMKATTLDCSITLQLGQKDGQWCFITVNKECVGHRLYALNVPGDGGSVPDWADSKFWKSIGLTSWWEGRIEKRKQRKIREWAQPITITECPGAILQDVCAFMNNLVRNEDDETSKFPLPRSRGASLVDIVIRVSYGGDGLKIKLVGLSDTQTVPPQFEEKWAMASHDDWSRYYSTKEVERISAMRMKIRERSYITHLLTNYYPTLKQWFESRLGSFVTEDGLSIESPVSDEKFKWVHAETVCKAEWAEVYESATAVRSFAAEHMHTLQKIADVADKFATRSREWRLPLSFPEIIEGDTATISFEALWPIDLIGRQTSGSKGGNIHAMDLRAITALGNLAAGISMLTGGNGAGKTTMGEELLGMLYDAASGFPVFGKNVKLNLRTVIGSIYLERGDGSTMQLSMVKLANVLNEVAKHPMNGTFVFWDEVGTGTSASQGERLGLATLSRLRDIGCTVLVNTQIPELAEKAQTRLGAKCFQVGMDHNIKPGIGEPDIVELAREMGLAEALNLQ